MENEKVTLTALNSEDSDLVYQIYNDPLVVENALLSYEFPINDLKVKKMMDTWLTSSKQIHFVISQNNIRHGIAQIFNICYKNRKCNLGILILPDSIGKKIGTSTLEILLDICYNQLNLHKLEVDIIEDNTISINLVKKYNFELEGTSKESLYRHGKYRNIHHFGKIKKTYFENQKE